MKAVVICRTRNESANIDRFCQAHRWADLVLIADGGSSDDTVARAVKYPNVVVEPFTEKTYRKNYWRNPHGRHINFMIDWAKRQGADWIIFDDCDCVPTQALQAQIRGILEATDKRVIELYRLYIWGSDQYFPHLNMPGQSLWGWRTDMLIRAEDNDFSHDIAKIWADEQALKLEHPLSCLHYFCPDEVTVKRKLDFYRDSGEQPDALHPMQGCGPLEQLPDWAK